MLFPTFKQHIKRYLIRKFQLPDRDHFEYKIYKGEEERLLGKVALVTGATGAIGTAICLRLALEGCTVGVCGRTIEKINHTISDIQHVSPKAKLSPVLLDVTCDNEIQTSVAKFLADNGKIDILINNAGGGSRNKATELHNQEVDVIDSILNTNLRGTIMVTKCVSSVMIQQHSGRIVNLSSVMGICGKEKWSEYSASKSGIIGFTKSMALELAQYNVTVNSVAPGSVLQIPFDRKIGTVSTNMNVIGRSGYTDEVAGLIAYLVSDEASFITGQNIVIDGGRSLGLPR